MTETKRKLMLADDFAGAMDAGLQLTGIQPEVPVVLSADRIPGKAAEGWMVLNTNTRNCSAAETGRYYSALLQELPAYGELAYLKIDSTLRGPVGMALEAVVRSGFAHVLVAPALPSAKRMTVHGVHYVDHRPLSQHEISKDPFFPVPFDRPEDIIHQQTDLPVSLLDLDLLRELGEAEIRQMILSAAPVIVADSETEEDLRKLSRVLRKTPGVLPCGSAGLIRAMQEKTDRENPRRMRDSGPALILRGSPARIGKQQLEAAAAADPDLLVIHVRPTDGDEAGRTAAVQEMAGALASGRNVAVNAAADSKTEISDRGETPEKLNRHQERIQRFLNRAAEEACGRGLVRELIILGGDSAYGVLNALGATWIRLEGAALPLVPRGRIMDGTAEGISVVTKAGGFGDRDTLFRLLEADDGRD